MATFSNNQQHFSNKKLQKVAQNFYCKNCDYHTSRKSSFDKHILTSKHQKNENSNTLATFCNKSCKPILCDVCGKDFCDRSGLWRHKKKCSKNENINHNNVENLMITNSPHISSEKDEIIHFLLKENSEFKMMMIEQNKQMIELAKNTGNNNNNITNTNSNNNTFNLQVFLNETCKDAMNIMDFVNSMEIELEDLEKVGELGYVNGMTNIILKNLKSLDVTKRPLHCTDVKREIMYIKDENKWEKETENKDKIKKALKYIMHKNAKMLNVFKEKYPDCIKSYSKRSDQYNKLVVEVLGGKGDNEPQHNEKIIRKIAREVTIDKSL